MNQIQEGGSRLMECSWKYLFVMIMEICDGDDDELRVAGSSCIGKRQEMRI